MSKLKSKSEATAAKPRLVVGITVDQMRADYLTRFGAWEDASSPATFGEGGFRRMVEDGFVCRDHHFGAPTHGAGPRVNLHRHHAHGARHPGQRLVRPRLCVERVLRIGRLGEGGQRRGRGLGGALLGGSGQMSPHRMLSTTWATN